MEITKGTAQDIASAAKASNPANPIATRVTEATRVPMSLPTAKLAVPDLPGYFLYWHLGKNVPQALRAGYTFVEQDELEVEQKGIANSAGESGSTDMGSRVSIAAGGTEDGMESDRLYLMKLPAEWRAKDEQRMQEVNEQIAVQLRAGMIGSNEDPDKNKRYMKKGQDLFYPKRPR